MNKYCRDQARDELWLIMGAGAAAGIAGGTFMISAVTFQAGLAGVQAAVVTRIAQVYGVNLIPASGAGATAAAIITMGAGQYLFEMGGIIAGLIPGIGQVVQPAIGATAVKVLGEIAITYFENMYPNKIYSQKTL
ncbi:MAG: hypothetical protein KAF91_14205 [Nostoc sp. TH1S01]|nr:hypothetical protein [Nostoc sp. TH1S01]